MQNKCFVKQMKIHKLPIIGGATGIVVIICSIIRWFFLYYDPSQMILAVSVGATICIFAYIYNWMRNVEEESDKINKRLDGFTEWWTKNKL